MFPGAFRLPKEPREIFFLWDPRQTGKTSLLRSTYPEAVYYDPLDTDLFLRFTERPAQLREQLLADRGARLVLIDEIQEVPVLVDEVRVRPSPDAHRAPRPGGVDTVSTWPPSQGRRTSRLPEAKARRAAPRGRSTERASSGRARAPGR